MWVMPVPKGEERMKMMNDIFMKLEHKLHLYWFTLDWWKYLFENKSSDYLWWTVIKCRINGHKCGVVWYSSHGFEPDMTCKGCGDDLG
jgi:hypothetical protein